MCGDTCTAACEAWTEAAVGTSRRATGNYPAVLNRLGPAVSRRAFVRRSRRRYTPATPASAHAWCPGGDRICTSAVTPAARRVLAPA